MVFSPWFASQPTATLPATSPLDEPAHGSYHPCVPVLNFTFCGQTIRLATHEGQRYLDCAQQIISGQAYPFPLEPQPHVRCVVDLGAHVGEWTVMAAVRWPQAAIHAYEPNPYIIPLLRENCRPYPNIHIVEKAIEAHPRRDMLRFGPGGSMAAFVLMPGSDPPDLPSVEVEVGSATEIADLNPDVLKLDIEGSEAFALATIKDRLPAIGVIYLEYHMALSRDFISELLSPSHRLAHHQRLNELQGEQMWLRAVN